MKVTKILSAVLAICMVVVMLPTFAVAQNSETKKITIRELMGDVVKDEQLTTADAVLLLRSLVSLATLTDEQLNVADANMDNEVNIGDAVYILRVIVSLEEALYRERVIMESFEVKYLSGLPAEIEVALPAAEMVEEESTYTVAQAPTVEGYKFLSWHSSFDDKDYNAGDTFVMPSEPLTLTALWEGVELPTPTPTPTDEPTPTPTQTPDTSEAIVTLKLFDSFNEVDVGTSEMGVPAGTTTITAANIVLPEGYKLADESFTATVTAANGVATPSTISVNVVPFTVVDDVPYTEVHNTTGFDNIGDDLAGHYILTEDLDFGNVNRLPLGWDWSNPDADDVPFTGVFDGNGHTITGLYIDHTNNYTGTEPGGVYDFYANVGLFCINDGTIKNINIYTRLYDGQTVAYGVFGDVNVGVVAGSNNGLIENCHVFGNVGSLDFIEPTRGGAGGITGSNSATGVVTRCSFEGGAEGFYYVGGLIGKNFGTLTESYFAGGINSQATEQTIVDFQISYVGGLCGGSQNATIKDCYTIMTNYILAYQAVGGITGWIKGGNISELYVYSVGGASIGYVYDYAGDIAGYVAEVPVNANLYTIEDDNNTELPGGFSTETWDMEGACCPMCPDLTKNRRGEMLYSEVEG